MVKNIAKNKVKKHRVVVSLRGQNKIYVKQCGKKLGKKKLGFTQTLLFKTVHQSFIAHIENFSFPFKLTGICVDLQFLN